MEVRAPARMEPAVKYHPWCIGILTVTRNPGMGPCQRVSLTGAVSSQNVTEEFEGHLGTVGNRAKERKGIRWLNCEAYMPSRCESRT